jgi:hypothetical protein
MNNMRKFRDLYQSKWLVIFGMIAGLGLAIFVWSKLEAAKFYLLLTKQVVKEDFATHIAMPICSFAAISVVDLEIINDCSLNVQCGENVKMVFRFSPFFGTSTFPDTVAEKLSLSCPEILKYDVLEETQRRMQKGG